MIKKTILAAALVAISGVAFATPPVVSLNSHSGAASNSSGWAQAWNIGPGSSSAWQSGSGYAYANNTGHVAGYKVYNPLSNGWHTPDIKTHAYNKSNGYAKEWTDGGGTPGTSSVGGTAGGIYNAWGVVSIQYGNSQGLGYSLVP